MAPIKIDGTDITGATIDGTDVTEITVDGQTVFSAASNLPVAYSNLVAWYPFDSATYGGSNADDVTAVFNPAQSGDSTAYDTFVDGDGTFVSNQGVTDINAGQNSNAVEFDGGTTGGLTTNLLDTNLPSPPISVSVWFNQLTNQNRAHLFGAYNGNRGTNMSTFGQEMYWYQFDGTTALGFGTNPIPGTSYNLNTYNHVVYWMDGTEYRIYLNNNLVATNNDTRFVWSDYEHGIGWNHNFGDEFDGRIDDLRIYSKALTTSEINQIYQNTQP